MATQSHKDLGVRNAEEYEVKAKRLFVNQPACMKLLIVVDKLLTGFDAPSATYLYIDKDMRDHNLFQAICRVNRLGVDLKRDLDDENSETIFTHKEFGFIVDFKHTFSNIKNAITNFNDANGGLSGYDPEDIEDYSKMPSREIKTTQRCKGGIRCHAKRLGASRHTYCR